MVKGYVCPYCGSEDLEKRGFEKKTGKRSYYCRSCKRRPVNLFKEHEYVQHTESKIGAVSKAKQVRKRNREPGIKRYLITSAQNATEIRPECLKAMEQFAEHEDAEIVVLPFRYQNPNSKWTEEIANNDWWDPRLHPYLCYDEREIRLCKDLKLMPQVLTVPTATMPLSGLETISKDSSCIMPHAKLHLKCVATPQNNLPKVITTTGCITKKNYTPTKTGVKAAFNHSFSFIYVKVYGNKHFMWPVLFDDDGSFIHFDTLATPKGVYNADSALGLVTGDTHALHVDPGVYKATYSAVHSIVNTVDPAHLVWHDLLDFIGESHHEKYDYVSRYLKEINKLINVEDEIVKTFDLVDGVSEGRKNIIVASNHNEHLDRWLKEDSPTYFENAPFFYRLKAEVLENSYVDENKVLRGANAFELLARRYMKSYANTEFLSRNSTRMIGDIAVPFHGDQGANGSRGSIAQFSKIGVKSTSGHVHTPGILNNAWQVGTSSLLYKGYNKGISSWMHCHSPIYANGERSLIFIKDGEYDFEY